MSLDPDRVEQVARQIGSAFSEVCFPGNKQLLHPKCFDDMDVAAFRNGDRWQDIPERLIAFENAALSGVSAEGFRYLSPAYMIWTLKHFEDGDISVDHTIYTLDPGKPGDGLYDFKVSKYVLLTAPQREAVIAFLNVIVADEEYGSDATAALNHHWASVDLQG